MTTKEIREKEVTQLGHELLDRQKHLFELRSQAVTEKLEDPSQIGKTKKDIARIKTVMRQREIEAAKAAENGKAPKAAVKATKATKVRKTSRTNKATKVAKPAKKVKKAAKAK